MRCPTLAPVVFGLVALSAGPLPAQEPTPDDAARAKRLAETLDGKRLTVDFMDVPLATVLDYVRAQTGLNIVVDAEVRETFEWADTRVSLQLDNVTVRAVLTVLCDQHDLAMVGRGDAVMLTRPDRAVDAEQLHVQTYDIRDLCTETRDHAAALRDLVVALKGDAAFGTEGRDPQSPSPDELLELLKSSCAADSWDVGGRSMALLDCALVVRTSAAVHAEIVALLAELRAHWCRRVVVSVQAVEVDAATARAVRAACSAPPALDPTAELALIAAVAAGRARVVHAATLTGRDAQRIALRDGRQHRLAGLPAASEESVVQDGLTLDLRPVLVAGRGTVRCDCTGQVARLRPRAGEGPGPSLDVLTVSSVVVGPLDRPLLLASGTVGAVPAGPASAGETLLLLRVTTPGEPEKATRPGPADPPPPAGTAGVMAKLAAMRCSPSFDDAPLSSVLQFFRDVAGVNLVVDRRVFDDEPERAFRVTLQLRDVSGADAMRLVLEMHGLALHEREGYGWITRSGSGGIRGLSAWLAVYDVRDLTEPARVYLARVPHMAGGGEPEPPWADAADDASEPWTSDQLCDLVRGSIATESWDTPPNAIEPKIGRLILRNAPAVLAEVDRLLGDLRALQFRPVLVEALHIEVDAATWEAAKLGRVLSPAEADAVATRAAAGQGMRLAAVARVAGLAGQGFTVHAGRQLVVADAAAGPLLVADGVVVQVQPVIAADGASVHCALLARVQRADAAGRLREGLAAAETQANVKVPAGGAVVLGGFAADGRPGSLLVLRVTPGR